MTGRTETPLTWAPDLTISQTDPSEYGIITGSDLIQVDSEVVSNTLVVKATLACGIPPTFS